MIVGKSNNIIIRKIEEADIPIMVEWMTNPVYVDFLTGTAIDSAYKLSQRLSECIEVSAYQYFTELYLMIENCEKEPLGFIRLGSINWRSKNFLLDIMIGDDKKRNRGIGIEALSLVIVYAFFELNLYKIYTYIYEFNKTSLNIITKMGLTKEGLLREFIYRDGKYHDVFVMGGIKYELLEKYTKSKKLRSILQRYKIDLPNVINE